MPGVEAANIPPPLPEEAEEALLLKSAVTFSAAQIPPVAPIQVKDRNNNIIVKIWGDKAGPSHKVSESLDYEPVQNNVFHDRMNMGTGKKKLYGYTGHTLAKFIVTFATGVITGFFAVAMSQSVASLISKKNSSIQSILLGDEEDMTTKNIFLGFLFYWIFGSILVSIATSMVQYWAPASAGAGVTLVMAYLNGNHIPNLLRFSTLITKFLGTVCAVSSGLPMGPEGPMVHIGACVGSIITYFDFKYITNGKLVSCFGRFKLQPASFTEKLKVLDEIASDQDHREFVSAGVSAGISAAFGAPIGGVLFSMEEACSFWSRKTAWRCFIAAMLSTFTIQLLNQSAVHGMIAFTNLVDMENKDWLMQLPFLLINFAMAGLLGAAFNSLRMWLWKLRAAKTLHLQRIGEVIGLVFLCGACGFFFAATLGKCLKTPPDWYEESDDPEAPPEPEYGFRFQCEEGYHNDVATLFLSSTHHTIIRLFSIGHDIDNEGEEDPNAFNASFSIGALALYTTTYLILMSIGAGLAIPGGLFMPAIVLGASWGAMWGQIVRLWLPTWNVQPGLYALLAATGVLGGVFRSAMSLVVLMVEGTRGIDYLFGIILAVVCANWVAHQIHHDGVYESELERIGNVYMLRDEPPNRLQTLTSDSIMATGVIGFRSIESVAKVLEVLRGVTHNGFPVFTRESDLDTEGTMAPGEDSQRLEGVILRSQLLVLLQRRHFCDSTGKPVGREFNEAYELELELEMRTFYRRYYTHSRYLSATSLPLDSLHLDTPSSMINLKNLYIDMRPYMNGAPFTIRKDCSAARAHQVFVGLGLRHLIVVDQHNNVAGIITRKDLDHAAGHGWWRLSHMADAPKNGLMKVFSNFKSIIQGGHQSHGSSNEHGSEMHGGHGGGSHGGHH